MADVLVEVSATDGTAQRATDDARRGHQACCSAASRTA
jgi:hypothetical protein